MTWATGRVEVTGGHLAYHRTGGAGPTLVLSHGLTDNGLCWTRFAKALEADYDIIMLDARGHGASSRIPAGLDCDPWKDIAEAIIGLGLFRPVVMGHSVGARATVDLAASRPGLVSKVVLEDPPLLPLSDSHAADKRRAGFRKQVESYGQMSETELLALGRKSHPTWREDEFPAWVEAKRQVDPSSMPTYLAPWQDSVSKLQAPTLIIHGEVGLGSLVAPGLAREARTLNPAMETVEIPGAGHNTRRENFKDYLEAVRNFLQSPGPSGTWKQDLG